MATITKRIEVCDVCRDVERPVAHRFRASMDSGKLRTYTLCEIDCAPLMQALASLGATAKDAPARRTNKQVTLAEIDKVKLREVPAATFMS